MLAPGNATPMPAVCAAKIPPADGRSQELTAPAALLLAALSVFVGIGVFASLPGADGRDEPIAIVFPFWMARDEALARSFEAGERVLRTGRLGSIVVTVPGSRSGELPRGAWFSLRLAGLAGCLDSQSLAEERQ